jgi:transcriptional regulator with XRE-family HTH domain
MRGKELRAVLGKNLKIFRACRGMSQAALAEKAEISITFLSDIERGNKWPYMETLINLAAALNIEVYELLMPETKGDRADRNAISRCLDNVLAALRCSVDQSIVQTVGKLRKAYTRKY